MVHKPLTRENVAASRERTRKTQEKLRKRREGLSKRSRAKERETDIKTKQFAEQQARVETAAQKAAQPAAKPTTTLDEKFAAARATREAEEKPKGFSNVIDVLGIALNPLSEDKIIATTGSKVFNTAAEYITNAPYVSALILTGLAGGIKAGITKLTGGIPITKLARSPTGLLVRKGTEFVSNTKTAKLTASLLSNVAASKGWTVLKYAAIAGTIGTYPWSEWALGEAKEGMIFNVQKAVNTGDLEIIKETTRTQEEIFDITGWETVQRLIPYANIAFAFGQKAKALQAQWKINDKILKDEIVKIETGQTDDEVRKQNAIEKDEMFRATTIFRLEEEKKFAEEEREARAAAKAADRKEEKKARNADADFWAKQAAKNREEEAEDRQAIADFWSAYAKTKQKIANDNRPSNLNFGLL